MRMDVPTLKCDRCGRVTWGLDEIGKYSRLSKDQASGARAEYDLCPWCFKDFLELFMQNHNTPEMT